MDTANLLTRLAAVLDAHDWTGLPHLLHADFTCRLVHTGEEQVFALASFASTKDGLVSELVEVWADVDQQAPEGTRPD